MPGSSCQGPGEWGCHSFLKHNSGSPLCKVLSYIWRTKTDGKAVTNKYMRTAGLSAQGDLSWWKTSQRRRHYSWKLTDEKVPGWMRGRKIKMQVPKTR